MVKLSARSFERIASFLCLLSLLHVRGETAENTDTISIAHQLNTYFINEGCELAEKLSSYNNKSTNQYIKWSFRDRFSFRRILVHKFHDLIMAINLSK